MKLNLTAISRWEPLPFWLYLVAITATETLTIFLYPMVGIIAYSLILITFIIQSVFIEDPVKRNLVLALSLVPLVRILSLAMPLGQLSLVYRFPLIYTPLLAATITVMWVTGLKPSTVGINLRYWPYQVAGGLITGIGIGITEYLIIGTSPLINRFTFQEFWLPALILLFTTGLVEELIFRGILQHLAETMMGRQGIVYVSLILQYCISGSSRGVTLFLSFLWLCFAATVKRTGSLLGAILSHGVANIVLFLVAPFVLS